MLLLVHQALLESQRRLQDLVPGWRFNLGFSGKYYQRGYPEENDGDRMLLGEWVSLEDGKHSFLTLLMSVIVCWTRLKYKMLKNATWESLEPENAIHKWDAIFQIMSRISGGLDTCGGTPSPMNWHRMNWRSRCSSIRSLQSSMASPLIQVYSSKEEAEKIGWKYEV